MAAHWPSATDETIPGAPSGTPFSQKTPIPYTKNFPVQDDASARGVFWFFVYLPAGQKKQDRRQLAPAPVLRGRVPGQGEFFYFLRVGTMTSRPPM